MLVALLAAATALVCWGVLHGSRTLVDASFTVAVVVGLLALAGEWRRR